VIFLHCMTMYPTFSIQSESSPLYERAAVVGLVVLMHLLVLLAYWAQPEPPAVQINEMSISFSNPQMQQADVTPQPKPKPREVEPEPVPTDEPAAKQVAPQEQPITSTPSPVQLDAEPDYKAEYLNNARPPYPLVARRMGYTGKVILNVEVLAEGRAGQVVLYQSSGHDVLDNAALQTVKTWKFSPAKRFGQPVTQWFLVPIKFSLEEN